MRRWIVIAAGSLLLVGLGFLTGGERSGRRRTAPQPVAAGEPASVSSPVLAPASALAAPPRDYTTRARALIAAWQRHASDLRQAMRAHPQYRDYEACRKRGGACSGLLSDLLYGGLHGELTRRMREGAYGVARLVTPETEAALHAELAAQAADSEDVVERVSALVILSRENGFVDRELPQAAYTGLGERSAAEVQHLLRRHRSVEVKDPRSVDEVLAAAANTRNDVRIRRSAIQALGHGASAERLSELVETLPPDQLELRSMVPAIASCGGACGDTVARLMQSGDPNARLASYKAAALAPAPERARLVERILRFSPPASALAPGELAERAALLPNI